MHVQDYWNTIGSKKDFEDPLYLERLAPFLTKNSLIVEYGCGYGRMLAQLKAEGYHNLKGFDFSASMIQRGKTENPDLDLRLVNESGTIPLADASVDAVVVSTVLCSMVNQIEQKNLISEISRILKNTGVLYITDFLQCDHPYFNEKYAKGVKEFGEWGLYTTSEGLTVRHHTTKWIMQLLANFDVHWFEQFNFKTMNQNPARTFHCVAIKC